MSTDDIQLRSIAQVALTTHITPKVRSISLDIDPGSKQILFRAYSDGPLSESAHDALSCAVAEVIAAYPVDWNIKEEYISLPEPGRMEYLRLVAYARCEDEWVDRSA
jgi:hypothetical protein